MEWTTDLLQTERLLLRATRTADRELVARILTDPEVRRFLGGPVKADVVERICGGPIDQQEGMFVAELVESGAGVGTFSIEWDREEAELSYQLLPEFWGIGFAFEACTALLDWVWDTTSAPTVIAVTHAANQRSLHLLGRLGFTPDNTFMEDGDPQAQMRLVRPEGWR